MIKELKRQKWIWLDRIQLRREIKSHKDPYKIIIGAGQTNYDHWIITDYPVFNAINFWEWKFLFRKGNISNLLSEHVLEHLSQNEVAKVLENSYKYLCDGGIFRIAVPDQFHINPKYIEYVRPNGNGPGAHDHKSFWNYKSLIELAKDVGFKTNPIEYWNEQGKFCYQDFDNMNGIIKRSKSKGYLNNIEDYSSLIIDLIK